MNELIYKKFTAVVPAYNEGSRLNKVVEELLKIKELSELILVDDGSTDDTEKRVRQFFADPRFCYFRHRKNKGKGAALKTGLSKAKSEIVLFLDADLENITSLKIKKIVMPVLHDEVDFARGSFRLARGRVTEIAVKPMMKILFPDVYFDQPISGQVCAKKEFLKRVNFEDRWGVDIGILLDAIQDGQRIVEIDIGKLEHKARSTDEKIEMAEQVLESMIKKAGLIQHKYKLVIFTLDDTLIQKQTLERIFKKLGVADKIAVNQNKLNLGKISQKEFLTRNARQFSGLEVGRIKEICQKVHLTKYSEEVIRALKKRKYQVAIISSNFSPLVESIAERLGVVNIECVGLEIANGVLTGEITEGSKQRWLNTDFEEAFKIAFHRIIRGTKTKSAEIVMVASSERSIPLMLSSGLSIAYRSKSQVLKMLADKTISVHAEILAIIE